MLAMVWDFLIKYLWAIVLFLIIAAFLCRPNIEIALVNKKLENAIDTQKKIKSMQIEIEKSYYKKGSITKKEFKSLMNDYENRLSKAIENEKAYKKSLSDKTKKYALKK